MDRARDRALVAGLQRGEAAALKELADLYAPRIHQLAMRHMGNREDAEEVTQDVLLKVHRNAQRFRGDSALSSWIYRITFNTAMSRLRHQRVRARADQREVSRDHDPYKACPAAVADWSSLPDEQLLRSELRATVAAALQQLPEMYREAVVLRDLRGLSTEEASSQLKLKDQTLKSRLHRGRMMLREHLSVFADGLALRRPSFGW